MRVIVKIIGVDNEWWVARSMGDVDNWLAELSVHTGRLLCCKHVDELPDDVVRTYVSNDHRIDVFRPATPAALSNSEHQRKFREIKSKTHRLLRVWVPINRYDEAKKYCKSLEMEDE